MDETTLKQFEVIFSLLRERIYSIKHPDMILLDLDSTLLDTYGHQEGEGFNYHYQAHGYHPLLVFDGTEYSCNEEPPIRRGESQSTGP